MTIYRGRKYSKLEIIAERRACMETDETSYVEILRASHQPSEWECNKIISLQLLKNSTKIPFLAMRRYY